MGIFARVMCFMPYFRGAVNLNLAKRFCVPNASVLRLLSHGLAKLIFCSLSLM